MPHAKAYRRPAAPLCRHPAFVPLLSLWLAALLGGAVAVMPAGKATGLARGLGIVLPDSAFAPELMVAVVAALFGGFAGFALARIIVSIQSRGLPASDRIQAHVPLVAAEAESKSTENQLAKDTVVFQVAADPEPLPEEPSRHGKAALLLRSRDTAELAMPQLIERFAIALDDRLRHAQQGADTYAGMKPPASLAAGLRQLNRA